MSTTGLPHNSPSGNRSPALPDLREHEQIHKEEHVRGSGMQTSGRKLQDQYSGTGTKTKRQRQRTVMAIASLASVCCWFDQFGILGFDYYDGIATVEGPIGSTQKGSGEALTRSPQHDSTGPSPRLQEHHTATTCGSFPAWTGSQISPGVGEISMYQSWGTFLADSVERWTAYAEDFKTKDAELNKQIEEAKKAVNKSKENFAATQKASGASSAETASHLGRRGPHPCPRWCVRQPGHHDEQSPRNEEEHRRDHFATDETTTHPTGGTSGAWRRSGGCPKEGFTKGRQLRPQVHCQCPATMQWNHSVTKSDNFLTEWEACEIAHQLAFELGSSIVETDPTHCKTKKNYNQRGTVRFCEDIELRFVHDDVMAQTNISHAALQNFKDKPWSLHRSDVVEDLGFHPPAPEPVLHEAPHETEHAIHNFGLAIETFQQHSIVERIEESPCIYGHVWLVYKPPATWTRTRSA